MVCEYRINERACAKLVNFFADAEDKLCIFAVYPVAEAAFFG